MSGGRHSRRNGGPGGGRSAGRRGGGGGSGGSPCGSSPCLFGGTCEAHDGTFTCFCTADRTGDRDFALPEWPAVDLILKTFELVVFTRKALESSFDWGPRSGEELQPLPGQIAHRLLDQFETRSLELES